MYGFLFFIHILHRVMNEGKHCECKEVIKSRKRGCSVVFLKMNIFYYINYKSDTCTLHVFRNVPNVPNVPSSRGTSVMTSWK